MNDFKSKLPNFQELAHMTGKFLKDMKHSVQEIVEEYKQKREQKAEEDTRGEVTSSTPPNPSTKTADPEPPKTANKSDAVAPEASLHGEPPVTKKKKPSSEPDE